MKKSIFALIVLILIIGCAKEEVKTVGMAAQTGQLSTETTVKIEESKYTCEDSDEGVTPDIAGKVTGVSAGQEYTEYDKCLAGLLVEYTCEEGKPVNQNLRCSEGQECKAGACRII